jgi:hypothetical protein
MDAMIPQFKDEQGFNPFDPETGANFKLRIRKVEGYTNYEKSVFAECGPLTDDEAQLEEILGKVHDLKEFIDPNNFKPYEQLKERFELVLNAAATTAKANIEEEEEVDVTPKVVEPVAPKAAEEDEETIAEFMGLKDKVSEPATLKTSPVQTKQPPKPAVAPAAKAPAPKPPVVADDDTDALLKSLMEE